MLRNFLCLLGFHKWVGFKPTTADAIRGRFLARMKCYFCKNWHSDHDISLPEMDNEIERVIQKLAIS